VKILWGSDHFLFVFIKHSGDLFLDSIKQNLTVNDISKGTGLLYCWKANHRQFTLLLLVLLPQSHFLLQNTEIKQWSKLYRESGLLFILGKLNPLGEGCVREHWPSKE